MYYSDEEIDDVWPISSPNHITSEVPAGTIIIEDTRGLHKAGIPEKLLETSVFLYLCLRICLGQQKLLYQIDRLIYEKLSGKGKGLFQTKI